MTLYTRLLNSIENKIKAAQMEEEKKKQQKIFKINI